MNDSSMNDRPDAVGVPSLTFGTSGRWIVIAAVGADEKAVALAVSPALARKWGEQLVALADDHNPVLQEIRDTMDAIRRGDTSREEVVAPKPDGIELLAAYMRGRKMTPLAFAVHADVAGVHANDPPVDRVARWLVGNEVPDDFYRERIESVTGGAVPASSWEGR